MIAVVRVSVPFQSSKQYRFSRTIWVFKVSLFQNDMSIPRAFSVWKKCLKRLPLFFRFGADRVSDSLCCLGLSVGLHTVVDFARWIRQLRWILRSRCVADWWRSGLVKYRWLASQKILTKYWQFKLVRWRYLPGESSNACRRWVTSTHNGSHGLNIGVWRVPDVMGTPDKRVRVSDEGPCATKT